MIPILIAFGGVTLFVWYFANECCPHKATPVTGLSPDQTHQPLRQTPRSNPVKPQPKAPTKGTYKPVRNTTPEQAKPTAKPPGPKGGSNPLNDFLNWAKSVRGGIAKDTGTPDVEIPGLNKGAPDSPFGSESGVPLWGFYHNDIYSEY